jgi:hypothetical protein
MISRPAMRDSILHGTQINALTYVSKSTSLCKPGPFRNTLTQTQPASVSRGACAPPD